jgi:selenide,water dikinase
VEAVAEILQAARDVVTAAGGSVAGGHTIRSEEPIFGLAVQGLVHPDRVWTKAGAKAGDVLVLSKPLGTGIVLAGGADEHKAAAIARMKVLNKAAAEVLGRLDPPPSAVTDVTGFGLLGHGWEIAERSGVTLCFDADALPLYEGALEAAEAGVRTGGDPRNRAHLEGRVRSSAPPALEAIGYDPQTSGGLLAAVSRSAVDECVELGFSIIGEVIEGEPGVELRS